MNLAISGTAGSADIVNIEGATIRLDERIGDAINHVVEIRSIARALLPETAVAKCRNFRNVADTPGRFVRA